MEVNQKKRVSDVITLKEIQSWDVGDIITISAGTGVGKSYFIKNDLYEYAKKREEKILFLIHRKNALNQFKYEIESGGKNDVIDIKTYQLIKEKCKREGKYDFSQYNYIVSDEFHYYMRDAEFDRFIDLSLTAILDQNHCVKIFMSATGKNMMNYFNNVIELKTKSYELGVDKTFIRKLFFYSKQESLEDILNQHKQENKKAIIFTTAKKAYELYGKYSGCSIFNCSESNEYYKYVNAEKINRIFKNEKFDELFLFTTTTLDTGVNIIDSSLQTVICDLNSFDDIEQSMGRKRLINQHDYIDVYVRVRTKNEIESRQKVLLNALDKAKLIKQSGEEEFLKKYPRDIEPSGIYYMQFEDGKVNLKLNDLVLGSTYLNTKENQLILKYGYKMCIADWLDRPYMKKEGKYDYIDYESVVNGEKILTILEQFKGKLLYGSYKNEFLNKLYDCGLKKNTKSISKVQKYLKMLDVVEYEIQIERKRNTNSSGNTKRLTYWVVKTV